MEVKFIKLVRLEVTSSYIRSLLEGGTPHRLLTVLVYKTIKPKQSLSFIKQNNNFARASRFFVHFFAVVARLRRETT